MKTGNAEPAKKTAAKLGKYIDRLLACTGERDMYPILQNMLTDGALGIGLSAQHIVVDTNLPGKAAAPDLALYNGRAGKVVRLPDYLYAIIEAKPKKTGLAGLANILKDKRKYVQAATRWFFVADQVGVARLDLDDEEAGWTQSRWQDMRAPAAFRDMFDPVSASELELERLLELFEAGKLRVAHRDVERHGRRAFINTIRQVSRLLDEAVTSVIKDRVAPSVKAAEALIEPMVQDWGAPVFRWDATRGHPIEFAKAGAGPHAATLTAAQSVDYAIQHAEFAASMRPHLDAYRLEAEVLRTYAEKLGKEKVSFTGSKKPDKKAVATFAYETASLILSRMLMVRFSEDHGFLTRQISNGGVAVFSGYARYFSETYQLLLAQAYKSARALYQDLFDPHGLDWVLDGRDAELSTAIKQSLYLLSRWDFRTVRGDILSGVYDHYLDVEKRRDLGEVFTRPEIARYVLDACGWDKSKSLLDPACGTGTFLVEALRAEVDRLRAAGALDLTTAAGLLANIHGLDINPFSVSLSQIQILWHMMDLFRNRSAEEVRQAATTLLPHIMVDGGISSLETMGIAMVPLAQQGLALGTGRSHVAGRRMHDFPARFRQINGGHYDVVVGNPPYVRAARRAKEYLADDYDAVATRQFDLYVPFVFRALKWWLKDGGRMGLVLPLAILDANYAEALRAVLAEYRIVEIVDLELLRKKTFHGVKRPTIVLIVEKTAAGPEQDVVVTTVPPGSHDPETDIVDMGKATKVTLKRRDLAQTAFLPAAFLADDELVGFSAATTGAGAELTTKLKPGDLPALTKMAQAPRLVEAIDIAWVSPTDPNDFTVAPTDEQRKVRRPSPLIQYGLKLGGNAALGGTDGFDVYKGLNIFPGRLLGQPLGSWDVGKESSLNIYKYRTLLETGRVYASREIAQVPTIVPVPAGAAFQNTAMIFQLKTAFPINVWVLSRAVQFYAAKLLRGSVIEDITAHWYKRQLCLLPMPATVTPTLIAELEEVGERLFGADREMANELAVLDAITAVGSRSLRQLVADDDALAAGIDLTPLPTGAMTIDAIGTDDDMLRFSEDVSVIVPNEHLRGWIEHGIRRRLEDGPIELTREAMLDTAVPTAIEDAVREIARLAASDPDGAYAAALDELDAIVGPALGLDGVDLAYIAAEMSTDDYLKAIAPALERRGLSRQSYRGDDKGGDAGDGEG